MFNLAFIRDEAASNISKYFTPYGPNPKLKNIYPTAHSEDFKKTNKNQFYRKISLEKFSWGKTWAACLQCNRIYSHEGQTITRWLCHGRCCTKWKVGPREVSTNSKVLVNDALEWRLPLILIKFTILSCEELEPVT